MFSMGNGLKALLWVIAVVVIAWLGWGLFNQGNAPEAPSGEASLSGEPIKIGFMAPLTGGLASYGEGIRDGVKLAIADLGLADRVELIEEDTQCEPELATNAASKLINVDGVVAIIGETCSSPTLAAAPLAEEAKIVMISASATSPDIADAGDFIFRSIPSDALQGSFGAKLVADLGIERLAVLHTNDDYGNGFKDVLLSAVPAQGGLVVAAESVERDAADMRAQLTKLKAQNPDGIYVILNSEATIVGALRQIKELELNATVIGSEGFNAPVVIEAAGEAADGLIVTTVVAGSDAFQARFQETYGKAPGVFAAQAYDAFYALGLALKDGSVTPEAIRDYLYDVQFDGATGPIDFDEKGEVTGNYDVLVFDAEEKTFSSTSAEELLSMEEDTGETISVE